MYITRLELWRPGLGLRLGLRFGLQPQLELEPGLGPGLGVGEWGCTHSWVWGW